MCLSAVVAAASPEGSVYGRTNSVRSTVSVSSHQKYGTRTVKTSTMVSYHFLHPTSTLASLYKHVCCKKSACPSEYCYYYVASKSFAGIIV